MNHEHLLVVEDEKNLRIVISMLLKQKGYKVTEASNGLDALHKLVELHNYSDNPIQLIVLDIQMPELNGLEMIDWLKNEGFNIPVVAISGYGNNDLIAELNCRGCLDYLNKPFVPEQILSKIDKILMNAA